MGMLHRSSVNQIQAIGESEAFLSMQESISRVAKTHRPVILIGERGTGKELAAMRLHMLSDRWEYSYLTLNCASLTPTLIESELFGHEAGAFTGASRQHKGRFELAHTGTLFLDEVATLSWTAQEKLLRVVEYGRIERVGGMTTFDVDVRLIAATNMDLRRLAREGKFRQDLLDRLSFEVIALPSLRQRKEDIPLLAESFARQMARELEFDFIPKFTDKALSQLIEYPWPGNIRELKNVVERAVYRTANPLIDNILFDPFEALKDFHEETEEKSYEHKQYQTVHSIVHELNLDALPLPEATKAYELARIRKALVETHFNQKKTAERLNLTYHQFRAYWRKYRNLIEDLPGQAHKSETQA